LFSAKEVWDKVIARETMGTTMSKKYLQKLGYKAKKVTVTLDE
jgi:hypothetical protein